MLWPQVWDFECEPEWWAWYLDEDFFDMFGVERHIWDLMHNFRINRRAKNLLRLFHIKEEVCILDEQIPVGAAQLNLICPEEDYVVQSILITDCGLSDYGCPGCQDTMDSFDSVGINYSLIRHAIQNFGWRRVHQIINEHMDRNWWLFD